MDYIVFEGDLLLGDSKNATMVFAQDFRVQQCTNQQSKLVVECIGVEIRGAAQDRETFSHLVFLDQALLGRISADRTEFTVIPQVEAGVHRVSLQVSTFPGHTFCDDFRLRRIVFSCR